jgi:hypothetical protein
MIFVQKLYIENMKRNISIDEESYHVYMEEDSMP